MRLMRFVILDMTRFHHDNHVKNAYIILKNEIIKMAKILQIWKVNFRSKNTNTTTYNYIIMRGGALPCISGFCPA